VLGSIVVKRSNRLLILLGLIVAISGAVAAAVVANGSGGGGGGNGNQAGPSASPTATPEPTVQVVVAKQDIHAGDQIKAAMVGLKPMAISERDALGADTFSSVDQVIGKIAGSDISNGKAIVASRDFISNSGAVAEGKDLSGAITQGMVAVSMELDQTNGVGTLIVPGDHVDIILSVYVDALAVTATDTNKNSIVLPGGKDVTAKMVIRNRRILATLLAPVAPAQGGAATANPSPGLATPAPSVAVVQFDSRHMLAIVEVMPEEAEVIRWAQREEKVDPQNYIDLSFALRSRADDDTKASHTDTAGITYYQLVKNYGVLPPDPRAILPATLGIVIQW
jgi:Flp pilus assembly protein CpaB